MHALRIAKILYKYIFFRIFQEDIYEITILSFFISCHPITFIEFVVALIHYFRSIICLLKIIIGTYFRDTTNTSIIIYFVDFIIFCNTARIYHSTRFQRCCRIFIGTPFCTLSSKISNSVVQIAGNKVPCGFLRISKQLRLRYAYGIWIVYNCIDNRHATIAFC